MKIRNIAFSIGRNFSSINQNGKEKILESLDVSIATRFLFDWSKRALDRLKVTFDRSKIVKQDFSAEFSSDCLKSLKRLQALWMVLWNILTLHTCLLMKHNPMGINRGLCLLEIQEILWFFSKIAICRTQYLDCILGTNLW